MDRLAGYIRRRGENVSSHEVAVAISEVAGVSECAVIGVPAPEGSEQEVFAFVVTAASKPTDAQQIWQELQSKLPYYAVPRYIAFVDGLPKNASQRVDLPRLRELVKTIDAHERMPSRPLHPFDDSEVLT
jgi:crotonobetaine/carnitine-CoA ligase